MDSSTYPTAFLFDLFGTLLVFDDFDKSNERWLTAFYELAAKPNHLSVEQSTAIGNRILHSDSVKHTWTGFSSYETKIAREFRRLDVRITDERLRSIANETLERWQNDIRPAADATRVLTMLRSKGRRTALVTNFDHSPHIRKILADTGFDVLFDHVVISDEEHCQKPDPEIFRTALHRLEVSPEHTVHVGDSVHDDVQGAVAAGIEPILIDRKTKSNDVDTRVPATRPRDLRVIESLSELVR